VIPKSERPRVEGATYPALVFQVVVPLVRLHVCPYCVKRGKRPVAVCTSEGFDVTVFVSRELDTSFEGFGTIGTLVRSDVRVSQQVVIVDTMRFESLPAVFALVGSGSRMGPQVKSQTVTDPECLPANVADVRFLPGVDPLVFDFLVGAGEPPPAKLASVGPLLALIREMLVEGVVRHKRFFAIRTSELFVVGMRLHVHVQIGLGEKLPIADVTVESVVRIVRIHVDQFVLLVVSLVAYLADEHVTYMLLPLVVIGRRLDFARFDWFVHAAVQPQRFESGKCSVAGLAVVRSAGRLLGARVWLEIILANVSLVGVPCCEELITVETLFYLDDRVFIQDVGRLVGTEFLHAVVTDQVLLSDGLDWVLLQPKFVDFDELAGVEATFLVLEILLGYRVELLGDIGIKHQFFR
jgi:hypothetical protein